MKAMVKGEIQTIPQCIFDKFSFLTYGLAMIQNEEYSMFKRKVGFLATISQAFKFSNSIPCSIICFGEK